jgi:phosphatidylglycerol---prolipoprotein diacylglyceryl transferase
MDKIAFQIGPLPIHWYGVFVALGFAIGLWNASRRALKVNISPEAVWDSGLWIIIGTIVGARLLYVVTYWKQDLADKPWTEIFMVHHGGLVFYGGLIGAILCTLIYLLVKKLPVWKFGDVMAPGIALGYAIGRIGCLMNGCCYGRPTDLPWAVRFPPGHQTEGTSVHPTPIYETLLNIPLYLFLAWLFPRRKFDGQVFATYLMCYAVLRSLVEFFRGDYSTLHGGWATQAHLISVAIFGAGAVLFFALRGIAPGGKPTHERA